MKKTRALNNLPEPTKAFICKWPIEIHKMVSVHASLRGETMNNWVIKAILELGAKESAYQKIKD